jgi:hypothetical protein
MEKRKPTEDEIVSVLTWDGRAVVESVGGIVWLLERYFSIKTSEHTVKPLVLALMKAGRLKMVSRDINSGALALAHRHIREGATYYGPAAEVTEAHRQWQDRYIARADAAKLVGDMHDVDGPDEFKDSKITYDGEGNIRLTISQEQARRLWFGAEREVSQRMTATTE